MLLFLSRHAPRRCAFAGALVLSTSVASAQQRVRAVAVAAVGGRTASERSLAPTPAEASLPAVGESQVQRWMARYLSTEKPALESAIARAQPWAPMVAAKLHAAGLPGALVYLPVVESGYHPWARSPAGAVGLWQFVEGTARGYRLRITPWVDERRDPYRATDAAVRYLSALYRTHGDWYLALAAYNAGAGRVARAVSVSRPWPGAPSSYWGAQPLLPRETRAYVPQLLAVARIGQTPTAYGLAVPRTYQLPELVRVPLPPSSRLIAVARVWGISLADIAQWNPALLWAATPPGESYAVVLPAPGAAEKRERFLALPEAERQLSRAEIAGVERTAAREPAR